ncbi:MAG: 4-alpha-glucanotransferase [Tissierellia bacterium]|nr:4-alpha-glucanotransferase [Tissierellia bacterium]
MNIFKAEKFDYKVLRKQRGSGVLMHITSLPNNYGVGSMGLEAREFANFLKAAGQKYWQLLPVGPTGYGDSPYQSLSSYAGNPYLIDLEDLIERGLIFEGELDKYKEDENLSKVNYEKLHHQRREIFKLAFSRFDVEDLDFQGFVTKNNFWLKDYALFMAIKDHQNGFSWLEWEDKFKLRDELALKEFEEKYRDEVSYYIFVQYIFFEQWDKLKDYLHKNGIQTIGDLPIYVAEDSADVWANPELFKLDENLIPFVVGGVPPDAFTDDGQLWGNPIYDWKVHEYTNFTWWIDRIKWNFSIFDLVRIDHFRGFESYWEVPKGDKTAKNGKWAEGPGIKLFDKIKSELGDVPIIAEDLGVITSAVRKLLEDTGFPGMKVLQFAFNPSGNSEHIPHNAVENSIMYTGTHDNDTILGWIDEFDSKDIEFAKKYLNLTKEEGYTWGMIRGAFTSISRIAIIQMQDLLFLDNSARMNIPGTLGDNWTWRMKKGELEEEVILKLKDMTEMSGRL